MTITITPDCLPDNALPVDPEFAGLYVDVTCEGALLAARRKVCFVGLARDIAGILPASIERIEKTARHFSDWAAVVVENDSTDGTKGYLEAWATERRDHVVVEMSDNGKPHLHGFEPERTVAMAGYRNQCQELVRRHFSDADYVIVVDLDAWGGWSTHGVINGIGWHERLPDAGCMASTSLFKHAAYRVGKESVWCHYDNWAYRCYGWARRFGPWFTFWLPPPGHPPLEVNSAFGGLGIYKTAAYLASEYSGEDCEHVPFHARMKEKGWSIFLNPAQRCVMTWLVDEDEEPSDGGHNGDDQRAAVPAGLA